MDLTSQIFKNSGCTTEQAQKSPFGLDADFAGSVAKQPTIKSSNNRQGIRK
jgi:hypothetical protein